MERFKVRNPKPRKPLPEDIYPAKLVKVEQKDDKYGPGIRFTFRPLVKDFSDKMASCKAWGKYDENGEGFVERDSKLHKWLTILNGGDTHIEELEPADLVGTKCRIDVAHSEPQGDDQVVFANVIRILPFKSAANSSDDDEGEEKPKQRRDDSIDDDEEKPKPKQRRDEDFEDTEEKPKSKLKHESEETTEVSEKQKPKPAHSSDETEQVRKKPVKNDEDIFSEDEF